MGDYDELFAQERTAQYFPGVCVAVVTNTRDPDGLGRVKLRLPWLAEDTETDWARIAVPMAGPQRGVFFPPEVDDEVLVAFEHGSSQRPYVVGALWNGVDKPPDANESGSNDIRMIKSRSGHVVRLTDTDGAEKIEVVDKSGKNSVVIDTAANAVTVTAAQDVTISADGGTLTLKGSSVKIEAQSELSVRGGTANVTAKDELVLKGSTININ
ncbi:phage baseplate assembly protein V [Dactylosporangium sp. NPDC051485]|uniref:phage baseplate assembly protein V n=1 Tax=Dactylosporangium sp. NPDC051485 TaxID=3154846 RepID=UPI00341910DE